MLNVLVVENLQANLVSSLDVVGLSPTGRGANVTPQIVAIIRASLATNRGQIEIVDKGLSHELTISMKAGL